MNLTPSQYPEHLDQNELWKDSTGNWTQDLLIKRP